MVTSTWRKQSSYKGTFVSVLFFSQIWLFNYIPFMELENLPQPLLSQFIPLRVRLVLLEWNGHLPVPDSSTSRSSDFFLCFGPDFAPVIFYPSQGLDFSPLSRPPYIFQMTPIILFCRLWGIDFLLVSSLLHRFSVLPVRKKERINFSGKIHCTL